MQTRDRLKKAAVKSKISAKVHNATNTINTQLKKKYYNEKITACKGDIEGAWREIKEWSSQQSKGKMFS